MARFCPSRAFILALGGMGFAVPFYFVQDCRGIWYTAIKTWLGVFVVIFLKTLYKKKQLLDSVLVISGIIKVAVSPTLIFPHITRTSFNICLHSCNKNT